MEHVFEQVPLFTYIRQHHKSMLFPFKKSIFYLKKGVAIVESTIVVQHFFFTLLKNQNPPTPRRIQTINFFVADRRFWCAWTTFCPNFSSHVLDSSEGAGVFWFFEVKTKCGPLKCFRRYVVFQVTFLRENAWIYGFFDTKINFQFFPMCTEIGLEKPVRRRRTYW